VSTKTTVAKINALLATPYNAVPPSKVVISLFNSTAYTQVHIDVEMVLEQAVSIIHK